MMAWDIASQNTALLKCAISDRTNQLSRDAFSISFCMEPFKGVHYHTMDRRQVRLLYGSMSVFSGPSVRSFHFARQCWNELGELAYTGLFRADSSDTRIGLCWRFSWRSNPLLCSPIVLLSREPLETREQLFPCHCTVRFVQFGMMTQ